MDVDKTILDFLITSLVLGIMWMDGHVKIKLQPVFSSDLLLCACLKRWLFSLSDLIHAPPNLSFVYPLVYWIVLEHLEVAIRGESPRLASHAVEMGRCYRAKSTHWLYAKRGYCKQARLVLCAREGDRITAF